MHNDVTELAAYAHSVNIAVTFPTNLSVRLNDHMIDKIVNSGLDAIYVSLDGASEETYSKYRVGGDSLSVLRNVRSIGDAKRKYGSKTPQVIWKFVVFDYNKHE